MVEDVTEGAATDDAFDVFILTDVLRDRFHPTWGFRGFRANIAFEMLLLADDTPDAASDCIGRCRIFISPRNFFFSSFVCCAIFSSVVLS